MIFTQQVVQLVALEVGVHGSFWKRMVWIWRRRRVQKWFRAEKRRWRREVQERAVRERKVALPQLWSKGNGVQKRIGDMKILRFLGEMFFCFTLLLRFEFTALKWSRPHFSFFDMKATVEVGERVWREEMGSNS